MAKQEIKYCENCEKDTLQKWCFDEDSDSDSPKFYLKCLDCGCDNDPKQSPSEVKVFK